MKFAITPIEPEGYEDIPLLSGDILKKQPYYAKHERAEAFKKWWNGRWRNEKGYTLRHLADALLLEVHEVSGLMHGRYECDWEELGRLVQARFPK